MWFLTSFNSLLQRHLFLELQLFVMILDSVLLKSGYDSNSLAAVAYSVASKAPELHVCLTCISDLILGINKAVKVSA